MSQNGSRTGSPAPDVSINNCLQTVEDYRSQTLTKWEAITQIASTIQASSTGTNVEQRSAAGATYLAMLNEHDELLAKAST